MMKAWIPALASLLLACNGQPPPEGTPRFSVAAQEKEKDDFEKENPKWKFAAGKWERRKSGDSMVLAQTAETQPWAVAILEDKKFADVDVAVKFRPISGKEDASGGVIFRARDAKNYYLVRANGLEDNFRLYTMKDGRRSQIATSKVEAPKLGDWHTKIHPGMARGLGLAVTTNEVRNLAAFTRSANAFAVTTKFSQAGLGRAPGAVMISTVWPFSSAVRKDTSRRSIFAATQALPTSVCTD